MPETCAVHQQLAYQRVCFLIDVFQITLVTWLIVSSDPKQLLLEITRKMIYKK